MNLKGAENFIMLSFFNKKRVRSGLTKVLESTSAKIKDLLNEMDFEEISSRNTLYKRYESNRYHYYVEMEINRYIRVLEIITELDPKRKKLNICDYGCMIPFLPTALAELGYSVTIVDKYEYYGDKFRSTLLEYCKQNGLIIRDLDILNDRFDSIGSFDIGLNLAVVEHFNGSPKVFLEKVRNTIKSNGLFIFDVPNIANLVKRVRVVMGHSPLDDYKDYLYSSYPYMGHNREMTVDEVLILLAASNFDLQHIETYDFNPYSTVSWKGRLVRALRPIIPLKNLGESIMAVSKVRGDIS
ncbi:MAG: hypothetical protein CMF45_08330 [Legionellales bacterium]|nr:hypothetical protein [Legionellales bacterium]|tara:strand:+ start:2381 stop:3274 length:894 start_codon:yes stop_codon:yes gene_type:complete